MENNEVENLTDRILAVIRRRGAEHFYEWQAEGSNPNDAKFELLSHEYQLLKESVMEVIDKWDAKYRFKRKHRDNL